jgi:hypothetical protein
MGMGPFESFAFPGVYTQTLNEAARVTSAGGLRFAAFVGVAEEETQVDNFEMIRGSSSMADNKIYKEDVSAQFTGANRNFSVTWYPVVSGNGTGTVTTDPRNVTVYINDDPVPVSSVNGTTGEITLVNIPALGDTVLADYYFKRQDDLHTDENLGDQVNGTRTTFKVHYSPIVQGDGGGITTTDVSKIAVKVNAITVVASSVDGDSGQFTLATAPTAGQTLTITYYSNEWQNTSDILPSPYISEITKVGYGPGTSDFVEGTDWVLDTTGNFKTINWGHSYKIASGTHTVATEYFDDSQITGTLYDNRIYRRRATGTTDGTNVTFVLPYTPVSGQGLGIVSDNPDHVIAYQGTNPTDATIVDVVQLDQATRTVTLATAPDASRFVYVTQYHNNLPDDIWTYTCTAAGIAGVGTYTVAGTDTGTAWNLAYSDSDTTVSDPDWATIDLPADVQVMPGYGLAETISMTFVDATTFVVTSNVANGTGSSGDNTGYLNQTYIDAKTGFRATINYSPTVIYVSNDVIGYTSTAEFTTAASFQTRAVPGIRVNVNNTEDIGVNDTATLTTYNLSGNEPAVGDFYYITYKETKQFDDTGILEGKLYTSEKDALADTGALTSTNKLGMAAHLAFLNGAAAVALLQIQKTTGTDDAPSSRYIAGIDYFNEPMTSGDRPSLMIPLTSNQTVLNYLKNSNTIQSSIRYANERMSYFGFATGTSPSSAMAYARALANERMIGIYPDGAITTIVDELGFETEYLVDGSVLAAAVAGRDTNPAFDVATCLTNKPIVGFTRLYRRLDSVTSAQVANSGLTLLQEKAANILIKYGVTTDTSSVLTREPAVIRIKDYIQKGTRNALEPYIGQKNLSQSVSNIKQTMSSYLTSARQAEIIKSFTGVKVYEDASDPTIIHVEAYYSPVLPILWILITFNIRSGV